MRFNGRVAIRSTRPLEVVSFLGYEFVGFTIRCGEEVFMINPPIVAECSTVTLSRGSLRRISSTDVFVNHEALLVFPEEGEHAHMYYCIFGRSNFTPPEAQS